ncbi:MAG: helix-turn-helix transcriptional regulator [Syntrophomonas sp.]|nr:helix-turn-helix transcriptional regulator [Proteiniphilum sp.]MDD3878978.1 helix-turn-helix transcriptional regulator [Syntrophomonas sp.]
MEANIIALNQLMVDKKLSQAQLADKIGVSRSCISRIMSGQRTPSSYVMAGFKKAFPEYSLDYYFSTDKCQNEKIQDLKNY